MGIFSIYRFHVFMYLPFLSKYRFYKIRFIRTFMLY